MHCNPESLVLVMHRHVTCNSGFSSGVTLTALVQGKTIMWEGVRKGVYVILFFVLVCIVGMLEGMQTAFIVAVTKLLRQNRTSKDSTQLP